MYWLYTPIVLVKPEESEVKLAIQVVSSGIQSSWNGLHHLLFVGAL